jgi:hypothetical protein
MQIVLLLVCFLLSTIIGVVHAAGCTPDPDTGICISTDKTTYSPGDTVLLTINALARVVGSGITLLVGIVPVGGTPFYSDIASASVSLNSYYLGGPVDTGYGNLELPTNTTAGHYDVEIVFPCQCGSVGIAVTSQTPVPETPSVLGLLLPALLVGIYVLKRKK